MKKSSKNIFKLAALGTGIGYIAGLLTAKQSGKETREDIANVSEKIKNVGESKVTDLYNELSEIVKKAELVVKDKKLSAQNNLSKATEQAKHVRKQFSTIIDAVKTGETDDKELKALIKNARDVVKNLKTYLK